MNITTDNNAQFWDSVAKPCSNYERRSSYAVEFLRKSCILEGESVFDMGCGSGTLCIPLADDGHKVFCADFSEKMLQSVRETIRDEGITLIETCKLSWQENWDERDLPICDLAFASRCMFDADPFDAVKKLSKYAKRKVCITLPVNSAMFKNPNTKYEVGEQEDRVKYLLDVLNAAFTLGFRPEVSYMAPNDGVKGWAFICWEKS